jgi:hypothetical protein
MAKQYRLSLADSFTHKPQHPERTAKRHGIGLDFDVTYREWPNRKSMLTTIRLQENRASKSTDWKACKIS